MQPDVLGSRVVTITPGKLGVCAGNYVYDYSMVLEWFRFFPVYDFDTVLDTISIRLRGKARLGKQHGCKSETISKT